MKRRLARRARRLAAALLLSLPSACADDGAENDAAPTPTEAPAASPTPTTTPAPVLITSERTIVDETRPTRANGTFPGAPSRTLRTRVWRMTGDGDASRRPLLLMAHGFGGLPKKFDAFAAALAGEGFVVAAPAFPLTNERAPGGHLNGLGDVVNQPGDLGKVLDALLAAAADQDDELFAQFDPQQVAVLGHSLGGVTLLGFTRKDCCADPRVRAQIYVSTFPAAASAFGPDPLHAAGPPTLVIHGANDPLVPIDNGRDLYEAIEPPRFFVGVAGATHSDLLESEGSPTPPWREATQQTVAAFVRAALFGEQDVFDRVLADLAAAGHEVRTGD